MRTVTVGVILGGMLCALGSGPARADDEHRRPCPECNEPTREVCFNLVCHYKFKDKDDDHEKSCTAAAKFNKKVTLGGGEVQDDSTVENNPQLEVSCDGMPIFNNSAHRYTDLLGTRIQGETGPNPAILLPRGALHAGTDDTSGAHYARSILELAGDRHFERARGSCFIWTGAP